MTPPKARRLLVADDEIDICNFAKKFFGKRGFEVLTSANGNDALSLMQAQKFDMVLLDLSMPGRGGIEVLAELRQTDKETKVIIISGHYNEEIEAKCTELGIVKFCTKPFVIGELYQLICQELGLQVEADFDTSARQAVSQPVVERGSLGHQIANKLNKICGACESYFDDQKDGFYKKVSAEEHLKTTIEILNYVYGNALSAKEVLNQVKEGEP